MFPLVPDTFSVLLMSITALRVPRGDEVPLQSRKGTKDCSGQVSLESRDSPLPPCPLPTAALLVKAMAEMRLRRG